MKITETVLNQQAQAFYEASGLRSIAMTDKPKIVAGLRAVLTDLGVEIEPAPPMLVRVDNLRGNHAGAKIRFFGRAGGFIFLSTNILPDGMSVRVRYQNPNGVSTFIDLPAEETVEITL